MAGELDIARWQQAAEYARREASACPDESLRDHWLEIAGRYDQLVRDAFESTPAPPAEVPASRCK